MIRTLRTHLRRSPQFRWLSLFFAGSYGATWELIALSGGQALKEMGAGEDEQSFLNAGERDAQRLLPYISQDAIVLDLGCGVGRVMAPLAPHCREIHGVDVARGILRHTRRRLADFPNVRLFQGGGRHLKFLPSGHYDMAFSLQTFHILEREDMLRYLCELHRVTKPGGTVYVEFQDFENASLANDFKQYALESATLPLSRRRFSTRPEVQVLARLAGFESFDLECNGRTINLIARKDGRLQ